MSAFRLRFLGDPWGKRAKALKELNGRPGESKIGSKERLLTARLPPRIHNTGAVSIGHYPCDNVERAPHEIHAVNSPAWDSYSTSRA